MEADSLTELEDAWAEVDAANSTLGWTVGRPSLHDDVRGAEHWEQWAYDPRETPARDRQTLAGVDCGRSHEIECVREMARCLREIGAGRVPR